MRIVNEILLKLWEKLKNKFYLTVFESWNKLVDKERQIMYIVVHLYSMYVDVLVH